MCFVRKISGPVTHVIQETIAVAGNTEQRALPGALLIQDVQIVQIIRLYVLIIIIVFHVHPELQILALGVKQIHLIFSAQPAIGSDRAIGP
jgi:hypothetical protein